MTCWKGDMTKLTKDQPKSTLNEEPDIFNEDESVEKPPPPPYSLYPTVGASAYPEDIEMTAPVVGSRRSTRAHSGRVISEVTYQMDFGLDL